MVARVIVDQGSGWVRSCGLLTCVQVDVGKKGREEKGRRRKTKRTTKGKKKGKTRRRCC